MLVSVALSGTQPIRQIYLKYYFMFIIYLTLQFTHFLHIEILIIKIFQLKMHKLILYYKNWPINCKVG